MWVVLQIYQLKSAQKLSQRQSIMKSVNRFYTRSRMLSSDTYRGTAS